MQTHVFLGGHDLEMVTIGALARRVLGPDCVHDAGLAWGARASAYEVGIAAVAAAGHRAVLVELPDNLPAGIDRGRLVLIDHHGAAAGADKPSALRQVFDLLGLPERDWSREFALVAANDIGHIAGLRALGADAADIRRIRDADRRAQGVTEADEAQARVALAAAERRDDLTIVRLDGEKTSAVGDFILPEYGGPGADNLVILTPGAVQFFGAGTVIAALADEPGCWFGGALPQRGFWGAPILRGPGQDWLTAKISSLICQDVRRAPPDGARQ